MFSCTKIIPQKTTGVFEPQPRSGHRILADDTNIYSIGGYNPDFWGHENVDDETYYPLFKELWQFNQATRTWTQLSTTGPMPVELASHSALLHGEHMLVFGGTGVPFGASASNKLNVCNLRRRQWKVLETSGNLPVKVYGQAIALHKRCVYVFGGTTGWEYNSDLHSYDIDTGQWSQLNATNNDLPHGRYRHEIVAYDYKLYIFGGGRSYCSYDFKVMPVFDIETSVWSYVPAVSDEQHGFPAARRCHSCVQLHHAVYISGGYDGVTIYDDIWKLDLVSMRWSKLPVSLPEPAYFHSAAVTPAGCMYIFGGVTVIDNVRTSNIYRIWLQPPSTLREMCWQSLLDHLPNLHKIPEDVLLQLGVPSQYVARIVTAEPSVCG